MYDLSIAKSNTFMGNPIRILHFINSRARGGVEEHILSLMQRLDRGRFQLYVVCDPEVLPKIEGDLPSDVKAFPVRLGSLRDVAGALRFASILRRYKIGILHSHMFQSSLYATPIGWFCRVPVIVETPHIREHWRSGWLKSHYFVDRIVGSMLNHLIAVSQANKAYLVCGKGLAESKISVIRSASDISRWDPEGAAPIDLKRSLGFSDTDPVIVVAGRLEPQKGHKVLLDAMPSILREFPKAKLVCLSTGSQKETLENHAQRLGIQHSVRFVGYQQDLAPWYALSDFTVLPSYFEGLPLAPIESLAAKRTVIATAVDGTPEVVLDGETGLTVPPGNPQALAAAACKLLRDPNLRKSMAENGYRFVREQFCLERLVAEMERFYLDAWRQCQDQISARATASTAL